MRAYRLRVGFDTYALLETSNQHHNSFINTCVVSKYVKVRKFGIIGKILLSLHRKYQLIFSLCGNKDSLPINNLLGKKVKNTKMLKVPVSYTYCTLSFIILLKPYIF